MTVWYHIWIISIGPLFGRLVVWSQVSLRLNKSSFFRRLPAQLQWLTMKLCRLKTSSRSHNIEWLDVYIIWLCHKLLGPQIHVHTQTDTNVHAVEEREREKSMESITIGRTSSCESDLLLNCARRHLPLCASGNGTHLVAIISSIAFAYARTKRFQTGLIVYAICTENAS